MGVENNIPEGWLYTELGKVSENIFSGGTPNTRINKYWNGSLNWLSSGETGSNFIYSTIKSITQLGVDNSSTRLALKDDVVVATAGQGNTRGQVSFMSIDSYINQSIIAIRGNKNTLFNKWLFYNLSYRYKELRFISESNSVRGSITTKMLSSLIKLKLPPLPEQKAIANVLTAFDDKIELLQAQNKTLETMAQTIFKEWFGKYQVGDELPEGWRDGKLGDIDFITFGDGNYSSKYPKQSDFIDNGVPFISNKNIKNGIIQSDGLRHISAELHSTLTKGHLEKWDIIMSTRANIGDIALVSSNFSGANINAQLIFIRSTRKELYTPYLLQLFSSKLFRKTVENYSSGSAQSQLPMHALKEVSILVPDEQILKEFSQVWIKIISKKEVNQNQIQILTKTRDTLLPKLMSGQVRVKNIKHTADA